MDKPEQAKKMAKIEEYKSHLAYHQRSVLVFEESISRIEREIREANVANMPVNNQGTPD